MEPEYLVGYCDRFSVTPGNEPEFKVSTTAPSYKVSLVGISRGEGTNGAAVNENKILTFADEIPGRIQESAPGSFAYVPEVGRRVSQLKSWSVRCWIQPTRLDTGSEQVVLSTLDAGTGCGWDLLLDANHRVVLRVHDADHVTLEIQQPIQEHTWYELLAGYDGPRRELHLSVSGKHTGRSTAVRRDIHLTLLGRSHKWLTIAARQAGHSTLARIRADAHFNGKVEDVCVYACAPTAVPERTAPAGHGGVVAWWDFAADVAGTRIPGHGPLATDAVVVNMPARAVTGHRWTGEQGDFRQQPDHYGAIHFHDDDVHDVGWETDFTLPLPPDLPSGVYAAKCQSRSAVDYIPFVVTPAATARRARTVVVLPSYTYLAYANLRLDVVHDYESGRDVESALAADPALRLLRQHPGWGKSLYDVHSDGSGVTYASWKRPLLDVRPGYTNPVTGGPREFAADLCLLHWLEQTGVEVDVITDHELHHDGLAALEPYRVVITGSHPEYCTFAMREAVAAHLEHGGRLMYLGGNGYYWVTSVHPEHPDLIEVRRGHGGTRAWTSPGGELHHSTTGEAGGLWRHRGLPPNELVGVGFSGLGWDDKAGHYQRLPASFEPAYSWIFDGVGPDEPIGDFGLVMGGAAGDELDRHDPALGGADAVVLARSVGHSDHYCVAVEDLPQTTPAVTASANDRVRADVVYRTTAGGGHVFGVGSLCWVPALPVNGCKNNIARITENVLRRFLNEAPVLERSAG